MMFNFLNNLLNILMIFIYVLFKDFDSMSHFTDLKETQYQFKSVLCAMSQFHIDTKIYTRKKI